MPTAVCSQINRAMATFRGSLPGSFFLSSTLNPATAIPSTSKRRASCAPCARRSGLARSLRWARLLELRRSHLEHPFRKCLAAPIPAPAQIAPPAIRLRPRCGDSAAVPRLGARPVVEPLHPAPPSGGSNNSHRQRGLAGIAFLEAISTRTPHFSTKGATASQPRVEEVEGTCEGWWAGEHTLWESVKKRARSERATQSGAHEFVPPVQGSLAMDVVPRALPRAGMGEAVGLQARRSGFRQRRRDRRGSRALSFRLTGR